MWNSPSQKIDIVAPEISCHQKGFTLLETIMAITILAVVVVQVMSIQASTLQVSKIATDNMKSTWAMRQVISQFQYLLDTQGAKELGEYERAYPWPADPTFNIKIKLQTANLQTSKVLSSVLTVGSKLAGVSEEEQKSSPLETFKPMLSMVDSQIPKDIYKTAQIQVLWDDGGKARSLDSGLFFIDDKSLFLQVPALPGGLGSLMGGGDAASKGAEK